MSARSEPLTRSISHHTAKIGPIGYLALLLWSLGMVMIVPQEKLMGSAGLCLLVAVVFNPGSFRDVLRFRYLVMLALLMLPTLFFLGEMDRQVFGVAYSADGALAALQIGLRFVVVLTAVTGFTNAVDIPQIASLLERFGLHGLGFSMGVALNLLPGLQQSSHHAWQALKMRGGLRRRWWRGVQCLAMTIVTNALRRAEDIALAAESRAFSPERVRPIPLQSSGWDKLLILLSMVTLLIVFLW